MEMTRTDLEYSNSALGAKSNASYSSPTADIEAGGNLPSLRRKASNDTTTSSTPSSKNKNNGFSDYSTTKRIIRNLSFQMLEEKHLAIDEQRLQNAVQDAGQYSYGIAAVEVWVLDDETGRLLRPSRNSGWWRDPTISPTNALSSLEDNSTNDVLQIMPGVCLAGVLFAESSSTATANYATTTTNTTTTTTTEPQAEGRSHRKTLTQLWQKSKSPDILSSTTTEVTPSSLYHRKSPSLAFWQKPAPSSTTTGFQFDPSCSDIFDLAVTTTSSATSNPIVESNTTELTTTVPDNDNIERATALKVVPSSHDGGHGKRLYWKTHVSNTSSNTDIGNSGTTIAAKEESPYESIRINDMNDDSSLDVTLTFPPTSNEATTKYGDVPWNENNNTTGFPKVSKITVSATTAQEKLAPPEKEHLMGLDVFKFPMVTTDVTTIDEVNETTGTTTTSTTATELPFQDNIASISSYCANDKNTGLDRINKKIRAGGVFTLSCVKFSFDKIFEDDDKDKFKSQQHVPSDISSATPYQTLSNNEKTLPTSTANPSTISSHRKSKSFHVNGGGLESLKYPLVSSVVDRVVETSNAEQQDPSKIHRSDDPSCISGSSRVVPSHRKSKSLYWQKDSIMADIPTCHILDCLKPQQEELHSSASPNNHQLLHFRDIKSLLHDPDTAKTPRLALLDEAGFSHAAGVPFQSGEVEGIAIYYTTRISTPNTVAAIIDTNSANLAEGGTTSIANQVYLLRATELIGAVVASIEARRAVMVMKLESSSSPSTSSIATSSDSSYCDEPDKTDADASSTDKYTKDMPVGIFSINKMSKSLKLWRSKCRGGNLQIPPGMSWEQCSWTFAGVLLSALLLSFFNRVIVDLSEGKYFILGAPILGPIGSVITLQYGSTSAPTAQPRNIILGQLVAGLVVLPFTYIPNWILPQLIRQAIAFACAVMTMVKLGIFHPPAGGAALAFSCGAFSFGFYILMVSISALCTIPATMINNLSKKRQYPTYWM